jgi:predicted ATPase/DNA-binding SARP family transcriptional activator
MSARLVVHTLGRLSIMLDARSVSDLSSRTAEALLIYLLCAQRPIARQVLATFFWDDRSPERAATNLRTLLTMLRKPFGAYLIITRQTVAFDPQADVWCDLSVLEAALTDLAPMLDQPGPLDAATSDRLRAALDLYQGDFLEGFYLRESQGFEQWTLQTQERLRLQVGYGLRRFVAHCLESGDYAAGIRAAERLLVLEPYAEQAHRQMMWLLVRSGRRNAALAHYQACRQFLHDELGVDVGAPTSELFATIAALPFPPPCYLPRQPTSFVGREAELAEIVAQLGHVECRLLTILGAGGMGKTRLAIQAAQQIYQQRPGAFLHGIAYVALADVTSRDAFCIAVAEALAVPLEGVRTPEAQLLAYLSDKEVLLVLDNAEDLLSGPHAADGIAAVLAGAPQLTVLATSRERLHLHEEWVFDIDGLTYPDAEALDAPTEALLSAYAAVQLFLQRARRIRRGFAPTADDWAAIGRICRLLAGMPLGLELAAAWVREADCPTIAARIGQDLDVLASPLRNVPDRHRSLRAVFEHSWQLLTAAEQGALSRLAVFHGRIEPHAAATIADVPTNLLAALVGKSLLRRSAARHYALHGTIRSYALEKLAATPAAEARSWRRYCSYYADLLEQRAEALYGPDQRAASEVIGAEFDNIRAAWDRTVADRQWDVLSRMLAAFHMYSWLHSRFADGKAALAGACERLTAEARPDRLLLARLHYRLADYHGWLSDFVTAQTLFNAAVPQLRRFEAWEELGWALDGLSQVSYAQGSYEAARRHAEAALEWFRRLEYAPGIAQALTSVGNLISDVDADYQAAQPLYAESLALYRDLGDRYGQAKGIINLGTLAHLLGDYPSAHAYYAEGIALCRELRHRQALAIALNNQGQVLSALNRQDEAVVALTESAGLRRSLGDLRGLAFTQMSLGNLAAQLEQCNEARRHYAEALRIGMRLASAALLADLLIGIAEQAAHWGDAAQAAELVTAINQAAIDGEELRRKVLRLSERLAIASIPPPAPDGVSPAGRGLLTAAEAALQWLRRDA